MKFKFTKKLAVLLSTLLVSSVFYSCGPGLDVFNLAVPATLNPAAGLDISPASGAIGTLVTLTGVDFSTFQSISIGGVAAIPINYSSTSLTAMVMPGAASGFANVVTTSGSYDSSTAFTITAVGTPVTQQGSMLVGTGAVGAATQGISVAVSADGNTALIGGRADNASVGASWVFTRSAGVWSQQGTKLVGTGAVGSSRQGTSVSLSADGNTALIGGFTDNGGTGGIGASWVFSRSAGVWSQQGSKLIGTGAVGGAQQGNSVALSADGNTALIGGNFDNTNIGASWIFTRSTGVWSQQGTKLVGTGAVGSSRQGTSVSLSADGNTALIGGYLDNTYVGATWVFTHSAGVWSQQGSKLVGTGAIGTAFQGSSVSLSADGNTALIGGFLDNTNIGASWVFIRTAGVWSQQGSKLVGTGAIGTAGQGNRVSLSADGNTALIGGTDDNSGIGASWLFTRSAGIWSQQGSKLVGTVAVTSYQGSGVALSADGNTALVGGTNDNSGIGASWVFVP